MTLKYGVEVSSVELHENFKRLVNLTYKLLPLREENKEWQKTLETIMEELSGMDRLIGGHRLFIQLLNKMEGLFVLEDEKRFELFRRTVFECIHLLNDIETDALR